MPLNDEALVLAADLGRALRARHWRVATAESCTGGLVAGAITAIAGSSDWFERGFVTYSNEAKHEMLGVPRDTLAKHGAVSPQTAEAMARGVLGRSRVHLAVSVTGIAGPDGGSAEKPVGLVFFAGASRGGKLITNEQRYGNIGRDKVRKQSVLQAFKILHELAEGEAVNPPRAAVS